MLGIVDIYCFRAPSELLSVEAGLLSVPLKVKSDSKVRFTWMKVTSQFWCCMDGKINLHIKIRWWWKGMFALLYVIDCCECLPWDHEATFQVASGPWQASNNKYFYMTPLHRSNHWKLYSPKTTLQYLCCLLCPWYIILTQTFYFLKWVSHVWTSHTWI